jgi:hypothetical protein
MLPGYNLYAQCVCIDREDTLSLNYYYYHYHYSVVAMFFNAFHHSRFIGQKATVKKRFGGQPQCLTGRISLEDTQQKQQELAEQEINGICFRVRNIEEFDVRCTASLHPMLIQREMKMHCQTAVWI